MLKFLDSVNSICLTPELVAAVRAFAKPLFEELKLSSFFYVRVNRQGHFTVVASHFELVANYIESGLPMRTGIDQAPEGELLYSQLWDRYFGEDILGFHRDHKCFHGYSIVHRSYERVHYGTFHGFEELEAPEIKYLASHRRIEQWFRSFLWNFRHILASIDAQKIQLPAYYETEHLEDSFSKKRSLILEYRGIQGSLSFRQLDCLGLYTRGFTIPTVASALGVSTRTVETHLDAVRSSFGLSYRDELAELAQSSSLIQEHIPRI